MDETNDQNLQDARQMLLVQKEKERIMDALRKVDPQEMAHKINDAGILSILQDALSKLREARPSERSERSRRYAVSIVEMEKAVAYFKMMIVDSE